MSNSSKDSENLNAQNLEQHQSTDSKISRREALKRAAKQTLGLAGLFSSLPAFSSIFSKPQEQADSNYYDYYNYYSYGYYSYYYYCNYNSYGNDYSSYTPMGYYNNTEYYYTSYGYYSMYTSYYNGWDYNMYYDYYSYYYYSYYYCNYYSYQASIDSLNADTLGNHEYYSYA